MLTAYIPSVGPYDIPGPSQDREVQQFSWNSLLTESIWDMTLESDQACVLVRVCVSCVCVVCGVC